MTTMTEGLPETLLTAVRTQRVLSAEGEIPLSSNIKAVEAETIFQLLCRERPLETAEIGCAHGISTLAILAALESNGQGHHHIVDPHQATMWKSAGRTMAAEAALDHRGTFYDSYPEEVFPTLPAMDFVFIDGSHLFDLTMLDFVLSDKVLKIGGIIGFHDTWMDSIKSVLRYILTNREDYKPLLMNGPRDIKPVGRLTKTRHRVALALARFISGESDMIFKRKPFLQLGLDKSNLVFIQKTGEAVRDWRHYKAF